MNEYYLLQNTLDYTNSISVNAQESPQDYIVQDFKYNIQPILPSASPVSLSEDILIPLSVISGKSSLEAVVLYLKDFSGLRFSDIARLLNRDQRTIWVTYTHAKKKNMVIDIKNTSQLMLPLSIFYSRDFSVLENIVLYLRTTYSLSFNQLSDLIGKNYQTVRTVYMRALGKMGEGKDKMTENTNEAQHEKYGG